jgi:predicted nucleic acid-binding protein
LGKGEAEAILLAKEVGADILLTDDRKARAAAASLNVTTMVEVFEKQGGLYLSPDV